MPTSEAASMDEGRWDDGFSWEVDRRNFVARDSVSTEPYEVVMAIPLKEMMP